MKDARELCFQEAIEMMYRRRRASCTVRALMSFLGVVFLASALFASPDASAQASGDISALHRSFLDPPDSSRIMMRWWWFGPAATHAEITRELEQMKAAGIGGVEIADLYPLELDNPSTGFHNTPYLSPEHLDALRFAAQETRRLGLRIDITLDSGWPFGGPHIPVTEAAGKLRVESMDVAPGTTFSLAPHIDAGEESISAFLISNTASTEELAHANRLDVPTAGGYSFPAAEQLRKLVCFISSRSGMVVKRPSVGAEGFVLDHYDRTAIENHIR